MYQIKKTLKDERYLEHSKTNKILHVKRKHKIIGEISKDGKYVLCMKKNISIWDFINDRYILLPQKIKNIILDILNKNCNSKIYLLKSYHIFHFNIDKNLLRSFILNRKGEIIHEYFIRSKTFIKSLLFFGKYLLFMNEPHLCLCELINSKTIKNKKNKIIKKIEYNYRWTGIDHVDNLNQVVLRKPNKFYGWRLNVPKYIFSDTIDLGLRKLINSIICYELSSKINDKNIVRSILEYINTKQYQ
jgi:hypothetical protein